MFFVDVDMFYKSTHNFLKQAWWAWNAKIFGEMSVTDTIIIGKWELAVVADIIYIRNLNGRSIGAQTFKVHRLTIIIKFKFFIAFKHKTCL